MLLGVALTIVALAASAAGNGYVDGREYVYRYSGAIYSSFPRIKHQKSGYAYNGILRIQPEGDHAIFKVDATIAPFNGEYENIQGASHEYKDLPEQTEFLIRPFRVYRKNGLVTGIEVSKDEPSFSANLKRGIASMFSLNFNPVESGPSMKENDIFSTDPHAHYYKVLEDTLLGECETAYVIEHHPYDRRNNIVLNVTKVPNFHSCKSRPNQVYSVFHGYECGEAEHEKSHTLHGNAQYHYSIRGNRHDYVIENIRTESDMAYTPYPLKGQTVSTIIKRSVELIEEKPVSEPMVIPGEVNHLTSLIYDFDYQQDFKEPIDLKMPHYFYHLIGRKVPIIDVRKQMEELVKVYNDESYTERIRDKDFPSRFVELLRSVASLGYDEIDDLYKTYADIPKEGATEEQKHYRNLFVDILVNLGTNPAFLFGKYLLENNKFRPQEAVYFMQQLQFHVKEVSETLLDNLQELCDHDNVKMNTILHETCIFSLSNIVFDHCVARYHPDGIQEGKHMCTYEAAVKYFNYIANLYEQTEDVKLKYIYMKAAGNMGVKEIIPYVEPYVEGHVQFDTFNRENALWALRHVGYKAPDKVRALLVPLLFNRTENYELRLVAFVVLLHMRPQLYEIEGMARALKYDPDDQVRAFVYSTFKVLANSTHICDREISKHSRYALRILEDVREDFEKYDFTFSSQYYFAGYDPDFDFGGSTRFGYYASDTGYIPRGIYLGFEDYIGGKSMHTFAFGIKQYGLEKFFDKIFGPEGSFGRKSVFDLFKKREKRDASNVQKEVNEIKEKLNLPVLDYDRIQGEIFFKHMGNHISSYQFDEKTFEQFFKDGRFVIPDIPAAFQRIPSFIYQRFLLSVDKTYVIPSDSGIPVFFDYKQPLYFYHKNKESSFRVEPSFFSEDRAGQYPEHIKAEMDGYFAKPGIFSTFPMKEDNAGVEVQDRRKLPLPTIRQGSTRTSDVIYDQQLIAYTGVILPFEEVIFGAGVNRRSTLSLPLKLKLDLAIQEKKLKIHWTPVAPHEIFHFKYEPFTFIDSYANSVPQVLEERYLPVKKIHRHEFQKSFLHDSLGIGFDVRTEYQNEFNDFGSWVDFLLKKDYREKFYYLFANPNFEPYDVSVLFTYAEQDATREVEADFSYNFHDNNWIIPHFAEENFEDLDEKKENSSPLKTFAFKTNIVAKGDRERKIHAVATWASNFNLRFHKINFYYERNPFTQAETENFKICGSSYMKYPEGYGEKIDELDTVGLDPVVNTGLKVHFGKNCLDDQKIKIEGQISRSEESMELERRREEPDTPEHYNPFSHFYHKCMNDRQQGIIINGYCWDYIDLFEINHKYRFHIKHENLSPRFLNMTYLLDRVLKYMYYTHSDHNEVDVHNPVDEMHIEANFSSILPVGDFRIQKPLSNSNYHNVFIPEYTGFNSFPIIADHVFLKRFCTIEGDNYVKTFDNYEYTMPPIDCWRVMVKDCSPNEHFMVLERNINHPKFRKALKVFLANHKIEHFPESEDSGMIVTLDGEKLVIPDSEPYRYHEEEGNTLLFYIDYSEPYFTLRSEKYGVVVERIWDTITVFVSPYYRSKLCGLCGNYNAQKYDGYSTENGCYYASEKDYAYKYSISSETCSVPKPELICSR